MKQIDTFYRLTDQEKDALIEQCRKRIEGEKIKETETVRKILEKLLAEKWNIKKKNAEKEMQKLLDELQQQVAESEKKSIELQEMLILVKTQNSDMQKKLTEAENAAENTERKSKTDNKVDNFLFWAIGFGSAVTLFAIGLITIGG